MQAVWSLYLPLFLAARASGQAFHTVTVGVRGSFFDPPTTNALEGDIITFLFGGVIHSVTQSSFEQPCSPLPGGFNSGLLGTNDNSDVLAPQWNLTISNASEPIWFFCQATRPQSHCAAGMVGTINAPTNAFLEFQSAAKAITGTPPPTHTVVLTGVGAFATASPSTIPIPMTTAFGSQSSETSSIISSSAPSSVFPTITSSEVSKKRQVPAGAVVGGVVGGVGIVAVIVISIVLLRRQRSNRTQEHPDSDKERRSPPSPGLKGVLPGSVNGSDLSDSETDRSNSRALRPTSPSMLSTNIDSVNRASMGQTSGVNIDSAPLTKNQNRDYRDYQSPSIQHRHDNSQQVTMADAFNFSPIPHPYAQIQYAPRIVSTTGVIDRSAVDVHETAKGVASLLGSGNSVPPASTAPADSDYTRSRIPRQLPTPRRVLREAPLEEESESQSLPRYER